MKFDATKTIASSEQLEAASPAAAAVEIRLREGMVRGHVLGEIELEDQDSDGHWIVEPHMWCENCNGPIWTTFPPGYPGTAFREEDGLYWHVACPTEPFPPLGEPLPDEGSSSYVPNTPEHQSTMRMLHGVETALKVLWDLASEQAAGGATEVDISLPDDVDILPMMRMANEDAGGLWRQPRRVCSTGAPSRRRRRHAPGRSTAGRAGPVSSRLSSR